MKNRILMGLTSVAVATSSQLLANNTVVLTQGPYSYSDGGEFTATTVPTLATLSYYSPYTSTSTSFQTFCVQVTTEFLPGATYSYSVNSISLGGPNYPGGSVPLGQPNSYPLSEGTAWLYSQFARGTLANYDYNIANDPADAAIRKTDAGILQAAIWALQGGQVDGSYPSGVAGNIYYGEALAALGVNIDTVATPATDDHVEIMNLSQYNGGDNGPGYYQNQLILVPDGGSTVSMLGAGFTLLALAGLRYRK